MAGKECNCVLGESRVKWTLIFSWELLSTSPNGIFMRLHLPWLSLLIMFDLDSTIRRWPFLEIFIRDKLCNFPSYCFWHSSPLFLVWDKNEMNIMFPTWLILELLKKKGNKANASIEYISFYDKTYLLLIFYMS